MRCTLDQLCNHTKNLEDKQFTLLIFTILNVYSVHIVHFLQKPKLKAKLNHY